MRSRTDAKSTTGPTPHASSLATTPARRAYIDWARGLAVLIMIQVHVLDSWTRLSVRSTDAYRLLQVIGGFAAPLFLWLAGVSLVLSAERRLRTGSSRATVWRGVVSRGLEVFILAFVFRLQSFAFSLGASPLSVFRVDVLNVMGLSIAGAGVLWGLAVSRRRQILLFGLVATGVAMATPLVRVAGWVSALPIWIQWYLRPAGEHTTFTGFPWSGFVFAGAAVGAVLAGVSGRLERRVHWALAVVGLSLIAIGFFTASLPSLYRESSFWTSSPTFFVIRVGTATSALSLLFHVGRLALPLPDFLNWIPALGRSSLLVYWVHVELVYGWATLPLKRLLSVPQALVAWLLVVCLMCALLPLRDRIVGAWRRRNTPPLSPAHA